MWHKIEKEHIVIFIVLLSALIIFNYFDQEFQYTGQVSKELDRNEVSGYAFWDPIVNFFYKIIGKKSIGTVIGDRCIRYNNVGDCMDTDLHPEFECKWTLGQCVSVSSDYGGELGCNLYNSLDNGRCGSTCGAKCRNDANCVYRTVTDSSIGTISGRCLQKSQVTTTTSSSTTLRRTNLIGSLDSADCNNGIVGWVVNNNLPDESISMNVIIDDKKYLVDTDSNERTDVCRTLGDSYKTSDNSCYHGFFLNVPDEIKDGLEHKLIIEDTSGSKIIGYGSNSFIGEKTLKCEKKQLNEELINPSLEQGLSGWEQRDSNKPCNVVTEDAKTGSKSAKCSKEFSGLKQEISLEQDTNYVYSVYVKNVGSKYAYACLFGYDFFGNAACKGKMKIQSGEWRKVEFQFNSQDKGSTEDLRWELCEGTCEEGANLDGAVFLFDDYKIEKEEVVSGNPCQEYCQDQGFTGGSCVGPGIAESAVKNGRAYKDGTCYYRYNVTSEETECDFRDDPLNFCLCRNEDICPSNQCTKTGCKVSTQSKLKAPQIINATYNEDSGSVTLVWKDSSNGVTGQIVSDVKLTGRVVDPNTGIFVKIKNFFAKSFGKKETVGEGRLTNYVYVIEKKGHGLTRFTEIDRIYSSDDLPNGCSRNECSYIDDNVVEGETYYYRIKVYEENNEDVFSDYSNVMEIAIPYAPVPENRNPVIISFPKTVAIVNEEYIYDVDARDDDGDVLAYSLIEKPDGMSIDSSTGLIKWISTSYGIYTVEIGVVDNKGGDSKSKYNLLVTRTGNMSTTGTNLVFELSEGVDLSSDSGIPGLINANTIHINGVNENIQILKSKLSYANISNDVNTSELWIIPGNNIIKIFYKNRINANKKTFAGSVNRNVADSFINFANAKFFLVDTSNPNVDIYSVNFDNVDIKIMFRKQANGYKSLGLTKRAEENFELEYCINNILNCASIGTFSENIIGNKINIADPKANGANDRVILNIPDATVTPPPPPPSNENCDNGQDDDGDGVVDKLDANCAGNGTYVYIKKIEVSDTTPYYYSSVEVKCGFGVEGESASAVKKSNCVKAKIGNKECENPKLVEGNIVFNKCEVGETIGRKDAVCLVNPDCNRIGLNQSKEKTIRVDVEKYDYCSDGATGDEIKDLRIKDINEGVSLVLGKQYNIKGSLKNDDANEETTEIVFSAGIVDLTDGKIIAEGSDKATVKYRKSQDYSVILAIPGDADKEHAYRLFVKGYELDEEDNNCAEESKGIKLRGTSSGTTSTTLKGTTSTTTSLPLERTTSTSLFQFTTTTTSENADIDNDELPDDWEVKHFGNLNQGPDDDYDEDGRTNLEEFQDETDPADAKDKLSEGIPIYVWIIGIIVVLVIIVLILFMRGGGSKYKPLGKPMYNKENIPYTGKEKIDYGTASAAKNIAQLKDYIRKSKIKGFTKEQIKNALLSKGWTEKEIEDAYKGT